MPSKDHHRHAASPEAGDSARREPRLEVPKLVVFDLDYTLWPFWCDTHVSPPLRPSFTNDSVIDSNGDEFSFYREVPDIFREIKAHPDMQLCAASRTHSPRVAQNLLSMLRIDDEPSSIYFAFTAWGTGTKVAHFQELHLHTGVAYRDMIFFDDETRNRDVERQLGVLFVEVHNGLTKKKFHDGIAEWQRRHAIAAAVN